MKKIYYIFLIQIIFYFLTIETSEEIIEDSYTTLEKVFREINPASISNKDAQAYTCLVRLRVRTYDYHLAKQQAYSSEYQRKTKNLYDETKTNAEKISSTEDPNIYNALQVALIHSKKLIES